MSSVSISKSSKNNTADSRVKKVINPVSLTELSRTVPEVSIQRKLNCACGGGCPTCTGGEKKSISGVSLPLVFTENKSNKNSEFIQQLRSIAGPDNKDKVNSNTLPGMWKSMGQGSQLSTAEKKPFEDSYGYDFSSARIHRGAMADKFTQALGVPAVSLGKHIVLNRHVDALNNDRSNHIIGHELAHIGQRSMASNPSLSPAAYSKNISLSPFNSRMEVEASRASSAALRGQQYQLLSPLADDLSAFPWLLLGAALLIAGGVALLAPSTEENARRAQEDPTMHINSGWVYVPGYGSLLQVWQARSGLERGMGMFFLTLDIVTLGMAGAALIKLSQAGVQSLRAAGGAATRELAQAGMRPVEEAAAQQMIMNELRAGKAIVGAEGALNHSVIYVMNNEGRIVRIHGGISRLLYPAQEVAEEGFRMSLNAFTVVEQGTARMTILEAEQVLRQGGATMLRSCSATQCLLLERAGVQGLANLVPRSYTGRFIPASVIGHQALQGVAVHVVSIPRLITGTIIHESLLLGGTSSVRAAGTMMAIPLIPGAPIPGTGLVPSPIIRSTRNLSPGILYRARLLVRDYGRNPQGVSLDTMLSSGANYFSPYNLEDASIQLEILSALETVGMSLLPRELFVRGLAGIQ